MRLLNSKTLSVVALSALGVACGEKPPTSTAVDLKITSLTPDKVFNEGGTTVKFDLENGCEPASMTVKIGEIPVTQITKIADGKFSFSAPAAPNAADKVSTSFKVTCKPDALPAGTVYGKDTDEKPFTFDPALEPNPEIKSYGPSGEHISVLARMTVTFTRAMDKSSVEKPGNIIIQGISGTTTYDEATKTATFVPASQLEYQKPDGSGGQYTAIVKGGDAGVKSKSGKNLKTTLNAAGGNPDPNQDSWKFTTRKEGEGNPWVGDISAAAGLSQGGGYKLFSVTGQPTPVGEAYAGTAAEHTYKVQSGFIYATQTGNGQ